MTELESDRVERKESPANPDRIRQAVCAFAADLPSLAREAERAEIRVYNRNGSLAESRVVGRAAQLGEKN